VHAYRAGSPQDGGAARLKNTSGPRPEARYVEPVRRRGGGNKVDAGILDRRERYYPRSSAVEISKRIGSDVDEAPTRKRALLIMPSDGSKLMA
jgi:hypothetical protein